MRLTNMKATIIQSRMDRGFLNSEISMYLVPIQRKSRGLHRRTFEGVGYLQAESMRVMDSGILDTHSFTHTQHMNV